MKEVITKVVLRNTITRKDAAYVIVLIQDTTERWSVVGYWGPWNRYQAAGESGLRSQIKYSGPSRSAAQRVMRDLQVEKQCRDYQMIDRLAHTSAATTGVIPEEAPPVESIAEVVQEPRQPKPVGLWAALELVD